MQTLLRWEVHTLAMTTLFFRRASELTASPSFFNSGVRLLQCPHLQSISQSTYTPTHDNGPQDRSPGLTETSPPGRVELHKGILSTVDVLVEGFRSYRSITLISLGDNNGDGCNPGQTAEADPLKSKTPGRASVGSAAARPNSAKDSNKGPTAPSILQRGANQISSRFDVQCCRGGS